MKKTLILISMLISFVLILTSCAGSTNDTSSSPKSQGNAAAFEITDLVGTPTDYSDKNNWLNIPQITYDVDTLYIYPTVYSDAEPDAPNIVPVDNETMRAGAQRNFSINSVAFSHCTNVFAPYYRQTNMTVYKDLNVEELMAFQRREQRTDVFAALDYYFAHYNEGRPFILAGHSQGSMMVSIVLREYMQAHPEYYRNMVAAYVLGFSFTKDDLTYNPDLKFAEGEYDTGVVVSWNIEGPGNKNQHNLVVTEGAISINPINWKRDDTYAPAEDNAGTYLIDAASGTLTETPVKADARVDTERGVVICTITKLPFISTNNPAAETFFGTESYHNGDITFYLDNLKENVKLRSERFIEEHKG